MSVITILFIILFFLMGAIGDEKGIKAFFSLSINFVIIFVLLKRITVSPNPIAVTFIFCSVMSAITLLMLNGYHKKTIFALLSVGIVIIFMLITISTFSSNLYIQGFDFRQTESIEYLSTYVNMDFNKLITCELLIGVFSAITDTAMTISSSMNEIHTLNPLMPQRKLYQSGMNIGSDILGTTVNTLFFVYFGNMLIVLIWFSLSKTNLALAINSKLLDTIIFDIIISGIAVLLVIPVTTFVTATVYYKNKKEN